MSEKNEQMDLFEFEKPVIKGYPELRWRGKRPFTNTQFYPAQLKEKYGDPNENGWLNKIFWGDNLQVMSHLLKEYRGKIDLIYIDPPFDSKADYKKKIQLKGKKVEGDTSTFEEKQYGDIWTNDEYLQFMYERLLLMKELLSNKGAIYLHCDWHKSHHLRCLMDDIFGSENFRNEIIWCYRTSLRSSDKTFGRDHDDILFYTKSGEHVIHPDRKDFPVSEATIKRWAAYADENGFVSNKHFAGSSSTIIDTSDETKGFYINQGIPRDWWEVSSNVAKGNTSEVIAGKYPTQKPEHLLEMIVKTSSNPGDIVFDCFMGSGTTQAVAMKLGRSFIGADINFGSIQTTTKRLLNILKDPNLLENKVGFEVYNVNNYDVFRNPIEAKKLIIEALNIQPFSQNNIFDGELDGRNVKILPINRISTKADLGELVANLPYKAYEKIRDENPNDPVDKITLICMGHEPNLIDGFKELTSKYNIDINLVDILIDKKDIQFKRESEADIKIKGNSVEIRQFFPMNLMQKLSLEKETVENWKQLVECIKIDYNYDGNVFKPQIIDIPEKNDFVKGKYEIPKNHGKIKVQIIDLLSEILEKEVE